MPGNMPDTRLTVQTRKKRNGLNSDEDSSDETLSMYSGTDFDSVLRDSQTHPETDPEAKCIEFTDRLVPGYQELQGDIFGARQPKRTVFAYPLSHCILNVSQDSSQVL